MAENKSKKPADKKSINHQVTDNKTGKRIAPGDFVTDSKNEGATTTTSTGPKGPRYDKK